MHIIPAEVSQISGCGTTETVPCFLILDISGRWSAPLDQSWSRAQPLLVGFCMALAQPLVAALRVAVAGSLWSSHLHQAMPQRGRPCRTSVLLKD